MSLVMHFSWHSNSLFDVTMGSYDGAEICELVGLFILNNLGQKFGKENMINVQYLCSMFNGQYLCPMDICLSIGSNGQWQCPMDISMSNGHFDRANLGSTQWRLGHSPAEPVHWVHWVHWIQWSMAMSNGHLNVKWPC